MSAWDAPLPTPRVLYGSAAKRNSPAMRSEPVAPGLRAVVGRARASLGAALVALGGNRRRMLPGDADARRPHKAIMQRVALLEHASDRTRGLRVGKLFHHRL